MGVRPLLAGLSLYQWGNRLTVTLACRSFWAAKVTLQGCDWQLGLTVRSEKAETESPADPSRPPSPRPTGRGRGDGNLLNFQASLVP